MRAKTVLTDRLLKIANLVPKGSKVADIGTDHAYLPIYLYENGLVSHAIASDIKEGPVKSAGKNIRAHGLSAQIELRLGAGLETISQGEADCIIIAGMGGETIAAILEDAKHENKIFPCYLLQPMSAIDKLRKYLQGHDFEIADECLAKEDEKIYTILKVKPGVAEECDTINFVIGKKLIENRDPLLGQYLEKKMNALNQAISSLKKAEILEENLLEEFKAEKAKLEALRLECLSW